MQTERLLLRPWLESDAEALFKYAREAVVGPIGWSPVASVEEGRIFIRTELIPSPETYAIVWKETDEVIGLCGLQFEELPPIIEREGEGAVGMGYWLGEPYWGRGIMPEAVGRLLERWFNDLAIKSVWVVFSGDNNRARRVAQKCGFTYRAAGFFIPTFEDEADNDAAEYFFSLTAEEYRGRGHR